MSSKNKWVKLGRVLREWGVRGELKCVCFNPESLLFSEVSHLYVEEGDGFESKEIEAVQPHDQYWRLKFKGMDNPEAAREFRGRFLALPREELPELEEGEVYLSDLEGMEVLGPEGEVLGTVQGWQNSGGVDALLVGKDLKDAVPIPYEDDFIERTDSEKGQVKLKEMGLDLLKLNE